MSSKIADRIWQYILLMRLHRPVGIYLLLWPTLWALWIAANGFPDRSILILFIAGVIIMRSAGCIINDWADRHFDGHVQRTKNRPLATGRVSSREAIILFVCLCLLACLLLLFLNHFTQLLAVASLLLAILYPFTKRYINVPQLILGLAFGSAIPMAFAAQTGHIPLVAWWLYLAAIVWAIIYDTEYAMVDQRDDVRIGIKSIAILLGRYVTIFIAVAQLVLLMILVMIGIHLHMKGSYYIALSIAVLSCIYQQYLIKDNEPAQCFRAFLHNAWFGLVIFLGIVLGEVK